MTRDPPRRPEASSATTYTPHHYTLRLVASPTPTLLPMLFGAKSVVILATALSALTQTACAAPVVEKRDIWSPPLTYPHQGTVWYTGQSHNVTWDISNPPENITNTIGRILLRKGGQVTPVVVAKGFPITSGRVEVPVPSVITGDDYQLVLMGDSGNLGPMFTIIEQ
ncbi:hypothetical protein C8Q80DRAFT_1275935 [Daedaleopsis nitida]|nr:hypothetical protein C8Q80DRAFT_1275935 [Daedaleopsis nitida]